MWTSFKVFIEFVTTLLLSYVLDFLFFWPQGMWDLRSLTRDRTRVPCIGKVESSPLDRQGSPD